MKTTLVCVVNGEIYEHFAMALFQTGLEFFHPTEEVEYMLIPGSSGWPNATMHRWHHLLKAMPAGDYVFMSDADMLFEGDVGDEILPEHGITATQHPGYVGITPNDLPYERRMGSHSCIHAGGRHYYCGGFVGGTREAMVALATKIARKIDLDTIVGITPVWHDESALNRCLLSAPPMKVLSPAYCYPDQDAYYKSIWPEPYERKLVAIDKTPEQRKGR